MLPGTHTVVIAGTSYSIFFLNRGNISRMILEMDGVEIEVTNFYGSEVYLLLSAPSPVGARNRSFCKSRMLNLYF